MKRQTLFSISMGSTFLSLLFLLIGIILPIILKDKMKESQLNDSYLTRKNYDVWAQIPGKYKIQMTKEFDILGIDNMPDNKDLSGLDSVNFSKKTHLTYTVEKNMTNSEYIEQEWSSTVKYFEHYIPIKGTSDQEAIQIDSVNIGGLSAWYQLMNKEEYKLIVPIVSLLIRRMEENMVYILSAIEIHNYYIKDKELVLSSILSKTKNAEQIYSDSTYGMGNINSMHYWIKPALENKPEEHPDYTTLKNYFGLTAEEMKTIFNGKNIWMNLVALTHHLFKQKFECKRRDCTDQELVYQQLSNQGVTKTPLIDLDNRKSYDTYMELDSTMNYPAEMSYFQNEEKENGLSDDQKKYKFEYRVLLNLLDLEDFGNDLSVLNPINGLDFFQKMKSPNPDPKTIRVAYEMGYDTTLEIDILYKYLQNLISKVGNYGALGGTKIDFTFAQLGTTALNDGYNYLTQNLPVILYSRMLAAKFELQGVDCHDVLDTIEDKDKVNNICNTIGFNMRGLESLITWTEAKFGGKESKSWGHIINRFGFKKTEDIEKVFDSTIKGSFGSYVEDIGQEISLFYGCLHESCTVEEIVALQWGSSAITRRIPEAYQKAGYLFPALTLHDWVPYDSHKPQEYYYWAKKLQPDASDDDIEIKIEKAIPLLQKILLETPQKAFVILARNGKTEELKNMFGIEQGDNVFQYLRYMIQYNLFDGVTMQRNSGEFIWGFHDYFLSDYTRKSYSLGGDPGAVKEIALTTKNITLDLWNTYPMHHIHTGQNDMDKIKEFAAYYGSFNISIYETFYNGTATSYRYRNPHNVSIPMKGTDGLQFAPQLDEDSIIHYFDEYAMRPVAFKYEESQSYGDLNVYKFVMDKKSLTKDSDEFNVTVPGFWDISSVQQTPLLSSCDPSLWDNAAKEGINYDVSEAESYFLVEPYSGKAVEYVYSQIISAKVDSNLIFPSLPEKIYPLVKVTKRAKITEDDISEFFDDLISTETTITIIRVLFLVLGGLFIVASIALFYQYGKRKPENGNDHKESLNLLAERDDEP
eukprot:TRINITY_DN1071_c0_g1_i1.p1 TRINITY_DN1071_c0_g1~~TRINITY_DN1071_c0_g1_i1.p1  ORF type:complete len:1032 (+),score=156.14 TRINITY_DN1071_c0_g1_i1:3-3098(+)